MKYLITLFFLTMLYIYATAEVCPNITIKNGKARRKHIFVQYTCNKRFILFGSKFSTCYNGKWDNLPPVCVRNRCTAVRELINGDLLPFNKGGTIRFWCKSGYRLRGSSILYCDGAKWNDSIPFCIENDTKPALSCDFESNDLCGWVQDINHDFDWTRYNINLTTWHVKYGPSYDHTKGLNGNGFYMFVDASKSSRTETARLISPIYDRVSTNVCLVFFYHMRHKGNGILNVRKKYLSSNWNLTHDSLLFTRTGYHGDKWNRAYINLGVLEEDYQIIFEAVREDSPECDIAFDDVRIIENCTYNDEEILSTTVSYDYQESTIDEEFTCRDRCFTNDTGVCSCDDYCQGLNVCCPDFFYYCLNDAVTDELTSTTIFDSETYTTQEDFTTRLIYDEATTKSLSKNVTVTIQKVTHKQFIPTTESNQLTTTVAKYVPQVKINSIAPNTRSNEIIPVTKVIPPTTVVKIVPGIKANKTKIGKNPIHIITGTDVTNRTKIIVPYLNKTKPIVNADKAATKKFTTLGAKTTSAITKSYKQSKQDVSNNPKTSSTKLPYVNKNSTAKLRVINFGSDGVTSKLPNVKGNSVIAKVLESKPVTTQSSSTLLIASVAVISTFVVLGLGLIVYTKCIKNYIAGKKITRRRNTSESDIRYLTSDEVLDFRLALLEDDVNDM